MFSAHFLFKKRKKRKKTKKTKNKKNKKRSLNSGPHGTREDKAWVRLPPHNHPTWPSHFRPDIPESNKDIITNRATPPFFKQIDLGCFSLACSPEILLPNISPSPLPPFRGSARYCTATARILLQLQPLARPAPLRWAITRPLPKRIRSAFTLRDCTNIRATSEKCPPFIARRQSVHTRTSSPCIRADKCRSEKNVSTPPGAVLLAYLACFSSPPCSSASRPLF